MAAQYYYLDADGQSVRGPFGLQDVWAMQGRGLLGPQSMICQGGAADWYPLTSFPELRPPAIQPARVVPLPPHAAAARRPGEIPPAAFYGGIAVALAVMGLLYLDDRHARQVATPTAGVTAPTPTLTAIVEPADTPDAQGFLTAVHHVRAGTILYHHGNHEKVGVVKQITWHNPVDNQTLETVIWQSQYGQEVVPMKYMDMYCVRLDGQ